MIVTSRAARNTAEQREAMMMKVCSVVREASGSVAPGGMPSFESLASFSPSFVGVISSSSSEMLEESLGRIFGERDEDVVFSSWSCCCCA